MSLKYVVQLDGTFMVKEMKVEEEEVVQDSLYGDRDPDEDTIMNANHSNGTLLA
jgi:hypothetical protein